MLKGKHFCLQTGRRQVGKGVSQMDITVEKKQDQTVVSIAGDIDYMNAGELKKKINSEIEEGVTNIVLDLDEVHHIDSMAIGLFAVSQKKLSAMGGEFALTNVRSDVIALLKLSSIDRMLNIYEYKDDRV